MKKISTTAWSKKLEMSPKELFLQLSKAAWVQKSKDAWILTSYGEKQGGEYKETKRHGKYIVWPENIKKSALQVNHSNTVSDVLPDAASQKLKSEKTGFRHKFEAKYRSSDGHFVRSKAEMAIDDWLYHAGIVHAYEKKLPISEDVYSDFYLPTGKVYVEYWGCENNPKYTARKKQKIELYQKYNFSLIQLEDKQVENLDDVLPQLLLKYGIKSY